jgi:hypothetical protein
MNNTTTLENPNPVAAIRSAPASISFLAAHLPH